MINSMKITIKAYCRFLKTRNIYSFLSLVKQVALAEWLRRVPAKYMGFPRESSNLSGDGSFLFLFNFFYLSKLKLKNRLRPLRERISLSYRLTNY